jgi:putative transposase
LAAAASLVAAAPGLAQISIMPGQAVSNVYVESLNGRLRDECLNEHWAG